MLTAIDILLHYIARWQLTRNGGGLLSSLCYGLFQLSLGAMDRATGMRVSTEIARTLRPAASSGATFARLVSCLSRARGDADGAVSVFMNDLYRKTRSVPERKTLASGLPVI